MDEFIFNQDTLSSIKGEYLYGTVFYFIVFFFYFRFQV